MRDTMKRNDFTANQVIMNKTTDETTSRIEQEIEQLRTQFSKSQASNDTAWNSSVLRVLFKNESFARKYKVKVEKFLKDLLEEGEEFVVYHPTHNNDEKEFEETHQSFHIDKFNGSFNEAKSSPKVPVYSSTYEDTLDSGKEIVTEEVEEEKEKEKPSMFTCFNCLGDHHMKKCPDKLDWNRINANKKEILLSGSSTRYHTDEQNNCLEAGILSDNLRNALGVRPNELPKFIYHMRVIGYPPGWMEEAIIEKSGIFLFDTEGKAVNDEPSSETGTLYDGTKFIDYPGFNSPVPEGIIDEWKALDMPPLQPHQQLREALKSPNIINKSNMHKRRQSIPDDNVDLKKHRNANESYSCNSKGSNSEKKLTSPRRSGKMEDFKTPDSKQQKRQSMSISMSPGTPVLDRGNPYQRLPDADKFAEGITEHLPFENLPDSVGTYEKMRGVISCVQKKLNDIKS